MTEARNLATDAVNAYTYDVQQKRADFDSLYDTYGDWITSLDKDQQSILDNARQEAIREEDNAKKDATSVMELMLKYPNSGIKITDTPLQATTKAQLEAATQLATKTGIASLTQSEKEGLASELVEVQKYPDKETAQIDFNKLRDSYLVQYGQTGMDKIQEAIDKLPSKDSTSIQKTNILNNAKSWISGQVQELKSVFGKVKIPQVKLPSATEVYKKGVETVIGEKEQLGTTGQSFFNKLFGF